jgi:hypothetical protein
MKTERWRELGSHIYDIRTLEMRNCVGIGGCRHPCLPPVQQHPGPDLLQEELYIGWGGIIYCTSL